jgi:hypothetical protein
MHADPYCTAFPCLARLSISYDDEDSDWEDDGEFVWGEDPDTDDYADDSSNSGSDEDDD